MAYVLAAVVGKEPQITSIARAIRGARMVQLEQGFHLLVWPDATRPTAAESTGIASRFKSMPGELSELLIEHSDGGPLAYIEAELFAGLGDTGAVVCDRGTVIYGPEVALDVRGPSLPINQALKVLGVAQGDSIDPFEALGLGRYRRPSKWWEHGRELS